MHSKNPIVSIGLPVYNMATTIGQSLCSILKQTYQHLEIIISDNSSNDGTLEIIKKYSQYDTRIRLFTQKENIGASANFKFVLTKASGKYFKWHAGDDLLDLECIEVYLSIANQSSEERSLVFSNYCAFDWNIFSVSSSVNVNPLSFHFKQASMQYLQKPIPSAYYGLFSRELLVYIINQNQTLEQPFDWSDVFLVADYIFNYGGIFFNFDKPLYYAGFFNKYVPKPLNLKFIDVLPISLKIAGLCGSTFPLYSLNSISRIAAISIYLNAQMSIHLLQKKISGKITTLFRLLRAFKFRILLKRHLNMYKNTSYFYSKNVNIHTFSQYGQDLFLIPFLKKYLNTSAVLHIIDIGANHPVHFSNSYLLEQLFKNVRTIAVDPLPHLFADWKKLRPSAIFLNYAVSNNSEKLTIQIPKQSSNMFTRVIESSAKPNRQDYDLIEIQTVSLQNLVDTYTSNVNYILLVDVEGYEDEVLSKLDLLSCKPILILAENNQDGYLGSDRLRQSIISHGYIYAARLGPNDDLFLRV